eukprot:8788393-Pyramimonas_sp.AAC.1
MLLREEHESEASSSPFQSAAAQRGFCCNPEWKIDVHRPSEGAARPRASNPRLEHGQEVMPANRQRDRSAS